MRPGKRKNSDGVSPLAIRSRSVSRISSCGVDALREQEVRVVRQLATIGVVIGVIGPQDVERAGIALIDEPAEIVEVMDEPEA